MFDRLEQMEKLFEELEKQISDPAVIADQSKWRELTKQRSSMEDVITCYREYKDVDSQLTDNNEMLLDSSLDADMAELIKADNEELLAKKQQLTDSLQILLLPKDPNDEKNVILEIRGGTGGEEAALFAGDLLRMYTKYVEKQGWKMETMDSNITEMGGVKEIVLNITGKGAYSKLKYESGGHRVQRVPETESGGRIHTSAATVAVLPEAEDVDIQIDPNDVRVDIFCSSGPGGQSVNTTKSAIRLTHIPTGIVVSCQDEKSQIKNKDKAMKVLRSRLMDKAMQEQNESLSSTRKSMIGSGDRSERIRTYNFPQGRVTDHRIGLTSYKLEQVLQGELDEFITALINFDQSEKLKAEQE